MDCYSLCSAEGDNCVGGLIGYKAHRIYRCFSAGSVQGNSDTGGLVGRSWDSGLVDGFWDVETSGQATSSRGGTGKTTAEMMQQSTFTNWDFTNTWDIVEGETYPFFRPPQ